MAQRLINLDARSDANMEEHLVTIVQRQAAHCWFRASHS